MVLALSASAAVATAAPVDILVVAGEPTAGRSIALTCRRRGWRADVVAATVGLPLALRRLRPRAVVVDLPDDDVAVTDILRQVAHYDARLPVLCLFAAADDRLDLGGPALRNLLLSRVRRAPMPLDPARLDAMLATAAA